jgi:hypothetical protein
MRFKETYEEKTDSKTNQGQQGFNPKIKVIIIG